MSSSDHHAATLTKTARCWVLAIVAVVGLAPPILYWVCFGRTATVTPDRAKELLAEGGQAVVLIDVRSQQAYRAGHFAAAESWPLNKLLTLSDKDEIPQRFQGKTLLLLCDAGMASRSATDYLAALGAEDAINVRGGIQEWIGTAAGPQGGPWDEWKTASGDTAGPAFRRSSLIEQIIPVLNLYVIKLSYTLLALVPIVALWRSRSDDLAALRWAMICFFLGENCCTLNYFIYGESSYLLEYLHSLGMLLCFGLTAYAVLEGFDRRVLMLSDPDRKCAALGFCGRCIKHAEVPCGLRRTFYVIIPACMAVALMPLCADWYWTSYNTLIFGTFYNYTHLLIHQIFENVYCPIVALVLLAASLLILLFKRADPVGPAKIAFAAGMGPLGFSMLRAFLGGCYADDLLWFNFWEETTELLFIAGVCIILWIFRRGLFGPSATSSPR